jgi:membrane-bound metal-dependent hydrolase YbcI (DUF457 family)
VLFLGHIAASLLIADATKTDRAAAIAGNLTPDVIDKTGSILLRLMPRRWIAHGLPFYALVCLVLRPLLSQRQWRAYALGYAGHLLCDLWAGGKVPWLAPFEPQRRYSRRRSLGRWLIYLLPELVGGYVTWRLTKAKPGSLISS